MVASLSQFLGPLQKGKAPMLFSVAEWTSARLKQTFSHNLKKNYNSLIKIKLPVLFIFNTSNFLGLVSVLHYY